MCGFKLRGLLVFADTHLGLYVVCLRWKVVIRAVFGKNLVVGDDIKHAMRSTLLRVTPDSVVCARCKFARLRFLRDKVYGWQFGEKRRWGAQFK